MQTTEQRLGLSGRAGRVTGAHLRDLHGEGCGNHSRNIRFDSFCFCIIRFVEISRVLEAKEKNSIE